MDRLSVAIFAAIFGFQTVVQADARGGTYHRSLSHIVDPDAHGFAIGLRSLRTRQRMGSTI